LTVADVNGCIDSDEMTLTVHTPPILELASTDAPCSGDFGSYDIDTVIGGTPPFTYAWSGPAPGPVQPGTYAATVTDQFGCTGSDSVIVSEPPPITIDTAIILDAGDVLGSIDITLTGGTPPYSFNWSTGATTEDVTDLISGAYTVTITDDHGCADSFNFYVDHAESTGSLQIIALSVSPNPANHHLKLDLQGPLHNVAITLTAVQGSTVAHVPFTESLDVSSLPPGQYVLKLTSNEGITLKKLLICR
jgi:hypothetical protein